VPLLHCTGELPVATFAVDGISLSVKTKTTIHSTEKPQLKMLAQGKSNLSPKRFVCPCHFGVYVLGDRAIASGFRDFCWQG